MRSPWTGPYDLNSCWDCQGENAGSLTPQAGASDILAFSVANSRGTGGQNRGTDG
jgi:hypothetical protein